MNPALLLLADPSPCLRRLVLTRIFGRELADGEVRELGDQLCADPLVANLLALQRDDGAWEGSELPGSTLGERRATSLALLRLGYLGFGPDHPAVARGAAYLFACQRADGAWDRDDMAGDDSDGHKFTTQSAYDMVPLQTALPLRGLAACGYAEDPRAAAAYAWLLDKRLPDGAWPTGIASGVFGRVAGYRRLPHSRWGCRSNTTGALLCLAYHPVHATGPAAVAGLDHLLARETREETSLGFDLARLLGAVPGRGFFTYFARFDLALLLNLCWRIGATADDPRVADLVEFVRRLRGSHGLWRHVEYPQLSRWLSFDLLYSLAHLDGSGDWLAFQPRTPFQPYPPYRPRY